MVFSLFIIEVNERYFRKEKESCSYIEIKKIK